MEGIDWQDFLINIEEDKKETIFEILQDITTKLERNTELTDEYICHAIIVAKRVFIELESYQFDTDGFIEYFQECQLEDIIQELALSSWPYIDAEAEAICFVSDVIAYKFTHMYEDLEYIMDKFEIINNF